MSRGEQEWGWTFIRWSYRRPLPVGGRKIGCQPWRCSRVPRYSGGYYSAGARIKFVRGGGVFSTRPPEISSGHLAISRHNSGCTRAWRHETMCHCMPRERGREARRRRSCALPPSFTTQVLPPRYDSPCSSYEASMSLCSWKCARTAGRTSLTARRLSRKGRSLRSSVSLSSSNQLSMGMPLSTW